MKTNQENKQVQLVIIPFLFSILFVLCSSILTILFYDRYFSSFIAGNFNTFCQDYEESVLKNQKEADIDTELLSYKLCKHPMKKKNFIWLHLDGFSFDQLKQIKAEISNDIQIYKSVGPVYRQTGAIHDTYMTGKPSLNLIGGQIAGDNFAIQIKKAEQMKKVELIGSNFPLFTLISSYVDKSSLGDEYGVLKLLCGIKNETRTDQFLDWVSSIDEFNFQEKGVHFDSDTLEQLLEKKYPQFANETEFNANLTDCLTSSQFLNDDLTSNHSMIYYSAYTDSLNHAYSKSHSYNMFAFFRINKILIQFIRYFQNHVKDSILFISSDHGGQFFNGEDNFCNHGCIKENNHGILLVASNDTVGKGQTSDINYLDVMPTVAQYLEGVNLPLFNRGIAYPMQKGDFSSEILALHQKFIQLKQYYLKVDNITIDKEKDLEIKYNDILKNKALTEEQKQEIIQEYIKVTQKMQINVIKSERSKKNYTLVNLIKVILAIGLVYIVFFNYRKAIQEWRQLSFLQKTLLFAILFMYFSDNILVIWINTIGIDFYHNSFYINIACTLFFLIFFSFFDFSHKTIRQLQLSFHKNDNRQDDFESQKLTSSYEQVAGGSTDSLDMFTNENGYGEQQNQFYSFIDKLKRLPFRYSKKLESFITLQRGLIFILILNCVYEIYIQLDLFVYTKKFYMETVNKWHIFNVFNYFIFVVFYLYPKIKPLAIPQRQVYYYIILFALMIHYDLIDLRYLVKKTPYQVFMCRFITVYAVFGLIYNGRRGYLLLKQDKEEKKNQSLSIFSHVATRDTKSPAYNAKNRFFSFIHIDIAIFVFYIADEVERVYLILMFFTFIFISKKIHLILNIVQAQSSKGIFNPFIISLFITVLVFKNLQFLYSAFKGTLSLDINLQSGNKTIGEVQDSTPLYTAVLFGIDKMLIMFLGYMEIIQLYFRVSIKENTIKFDNATKGLVAVILIKILVTGIQLCLNFFNEDSFLSLFIWFASMTAVILISFLPYSIFKSILFFVRFTDTTSIKKQSHHLSV